VSRVQAIVYMSQSVYEAENESALTRAMEYINTMQQKRFPYRVVPPVLPFSGDDIDKNVGICGKFIKFGPSANMSACFVAVITREVRARIILLYPPDESRGGYYGFDSVMDPPPPPPQPPPPQTLCLCSRSSVHFYSD
jgi:hypothetical protein